MHRHRAAICLTATAAVLAAGLVAPAGAGAHGGGGEDVQRVELADDCEADSFNRAVGPGTCVGDGETTFGEFLDEVAEEGEADDWEFDPSDFDVDAGERIKLVNTGGETHTFTEVANFGGGCVGILNRGVAPVPECDGVLLDDAVDDPPPLAFRESVVLAGDTEHIHLWDPGTSKFQCLLHPWMRAEVEVRAADHDGH